MTKAISTYKMSKLSSCAKVILMWHAGPLREKKCAGARCFLGPLSDILLWFSCFVVSYRLRLKKPAMCIKIFDEHLSIVAVQKYATESEFMTMLKSYIE